MERGTALRIAVACVDCSRRWGGGAGACGQQPAQRERVRRHLHRAAPDRLHDGSASGRSAGRRRPRAHPGRAQQSGHQRRHRFRRLHPQDRANAAGFVGKATETVATNPAIAISDIEILAQWWWDPPSRAMMQDCANTAIGVWSRTASTALSWSRCTDSPASPLTPRPPRADVSCRPCRWPAPATRAPARVAGAPCSPRGATGRSPGPPRA